jgi:hypothetical protein
VVVELLIGIFMALETREKERVAQVEVQISHVEYSARPQWQRSLDR